MASIQSSDGTCVLLKKMALHWIAQVLCTCAIVLVMGTSTRAQPPANAPPGFGPQPGNRQPNGNGNGNRNQQQNGFGFGAPGGAAQADFDSLIDLIESTVAPDSWVENGTGTGSIQPFPGGVFVDAAGTLRLAVNRRSLAGQASTAVLPVSRNFPSQPVSVDARTASNLRYVSLPRLEWAIALKQRRHEPLSIEMLTLAGLQRIEYVFVTPRAEDSQAGDLVLAGPAGDWQVEPSGRIVAMETGRPIVRLDDLLVMMRRRQNAGRASFGCSITPRKAALAATQDYLRKTGAESLEPDGTRAWLTGLRDTLGKQNVEFFGIDPQTRVARVLLAADYHMKLVGMGLVDGVAGVDSYLSTVRLSSDGMPPAMNVLRWWFTMKYAPVVTNAARDAFQITGLGVQVLSENEMLAAHGRRVHTGQSDELNRRFAESFTAAFGELSQKYPVYAELHNLFDMELVMALVRAEGLAERVGWQPGLFIDAGRLRLPAVATPKHVETVINHRVLGGRHIVAGVSGGVWIDAGKSLRVQSAEPLKATAMSKSRAAASATGEESIWWWD